MGLNKEEKIRYSRHLNLPQFSVDAQLKLKASHVLVVGAGGLGSPLLLYLTAAGVGNIAIIDFDEVDLSNLQRQILYKTSDIGKKKTSAVDWLRDLNPNVNFTIYNNTLTSKNALEIIEGYDVVADGSDNFPTRYLVNDACVLLGKTNIYASIFQFEGQVSVFNYLLDGEYGPNYRDLYPTPPPPGMVPSCAEGGVLGVLAGIIGAMQGLEVFKVLTGIGSPLSGKLLLYDALEVTTRKVNVKKDKNNPLNGDNPSINALIDYEEFCGVKKELNIEKINAVELNELMTTGDNDCLLVDVRTSSEHVAGNIGGIHVALNDIVLNQHLIPSDKRVIFYCKSGRRSLSAITQLMEQFGFNNLVNLEGGLIEWQKQIEPELVLL